MGVSLVRRHQRALLFAVLAAAVAALVLFAMMVGAGWSLNTARAAFQHRAGHHAVTHHAVGRTHAHRTAQPNPVTSTDGDSVQSGDQTTPDTPAETTAENESGVESEQGQPGEPANGHQDTPGQDVNHECTGNCVE
jgi:hypothetical protein